MEIQIPRGRKKTCHSPFLILSSYKYWRYFPGATNKQLQACTHNLFYFFQPRCAQVPEPKIHDKLPFWKYLVLHVSAGWCSVGRRWRDSCKAAASVTVTTLRTTWCWECASTLLASPPPTVHFSIR